MGLVTGTGCMLSALTGAFLGGQRPEERDYFEVVAARGLILEGLRGAGLGGDEKKRAAEPAPSGSGCLTPLEA